MFEQNHSVVGTMRKPLARLASALDMFSLYLRKITVATVCRSVDLKVIYDRFNGAGIQHS